MKQASLPAVAHPPQRRPLKVVQHIALTSISHGAMGGTENHLLTLCEHLDRRQNDLRIVSYRPQANGEFARRALAIGVPIQAFPDVGHRFLSSIVRTLWLARHFRRERPDVLHIHTIYFMGASALIAAFLGRVPAIVVTHHVWIGPDPGCLSWRIGRWIEKHLASRVIALNSEQASELAMAGIPADHVTVVPNGIDTGRFAMARPLSPEVGRLFRIVIPARVTPGKGHEQLIEAVARLAGRFPNLRLTIAGDGPIRPQVEAQVKALGIASAVEFAGWIPNEHLPALFRTARAVVLPSYWPRETFGLALLEGMAMGLPAIGTNQGGVRELIVDGETGFLVEPRDADGLATAIEKLLTVPGLAEEMGRRGLARVQQLFTAEAMAKAISSVHIIAAGVAEGELKSARMLRPKAGSTIGTER